MSGQHRPGPRPPRNRPFDELAARYDDEEVVPAPHDSEIEPGPEADEPQPRRRRATLRAGPEVEGERGVSPVGGRTGAATPGKLVGAAAMLLVAGFLIVATWDKGDAAEQDGREKPPAKQVVKYPGPTGFPPPPGAPTLAEADSDPNAPVLNPDGSYPPSPSSPASGAHVVPAIAPSGAPSPAVAPADAGRSVYEAAQRAPILAFSAGRGGARVGAEGEAFSPPTLAAQSARSAEQATALDDLRRSSAVRESRARLLPDRRFLITAGTSLPCVLQTALDSSVPGYATCIIPRDVLSDDGRVVLLEKGTKVLGEYQGGVRQGQRRLFVVWTRAVTPSGVAVDLASPAADALGRSGFDGDLDRRFWARFGGALLLSIVDDAAYVAGQSVADSRFSNTTRFPSEAAAVALQNSVGLQPVLRKRQGEDVSIFVAQDINFADVYGLELR